MEPNAEEDRYSDDEEERRKHQRPPSSYGSMKSDSDDSKEEECGAAEMDEDDLEETQCNQEVAWVSKRPAPVLPREETPAYEGTGVRLNRPASPETLYTMTTMQTKPPGALVIETGASDIECTSEVEEEYEDDDYLITNSPEPPEPIELDDVMEVDIHGQPGKLHPEQDLRHVFTNVQQTLGALNKEELYNFKLNFNLRLTSDLSLEQMCEGDLLDFVDLIFEKFGQDVSLSSTISTLEMISKSKEAAELRDNCKKALIRSSLKEKIVREYQFVFEGIPRAGGRASLDQIYVAPEILLCSCGGVDSYHEFKNPFQTPTQSDPHPDSAGSLTNLFRRQKPDGTPVRTVVTTGMAGIGMSMSVAKYCFEWAEERVNKDLEYVITLPFSILWSLREKKEMSLMDIIEYNHSLCKTMTYLDDKERKFLLVMDSFDCYQTNLNWANTPVINDCRAPAKIDHLIVNLVRGSLFPHAQIWILGRLAAISQIPSKLIDCFTEIHGFSPEMRDAYLRQQFVRPELGDIMIRRYRQLPTLRALARHPFICWMVQQIFSFNYRKIDGYLLTPPKLTPFLVNTVVVQTNRRLEFYYEKRRGNRNWSNSDTQMLRTLGKMAFTMLQNNKTQFSAEDLKQHSLDLRDVTVFSGLCTELPPAASGKRRFCFTHATVLEFMAALYVFALLRVDSKNALENCKATKSAAAVVQKAIRLTFSSPLGQYDMFLRFLCGLIHPPNNRPLSGNLYNREGIKDEALYSSEVRELVHKTIQTCPADRKDNIEECYREMTQEHS